jgi:hypothetical protein
MILYITIITKSMVVYISQKYNAFKDINIDPIFL